MTDRICSIPDCELPHIARGWCHRHYKRWEVHGDPEFVTPRPSTADLFERLAAIETDDHVLWTMSGSKGYGRAWIGGKTHLVHNLALERRSEPQPEWAVGALHAPGCPRSCMNYRHLRWGTQRENLADRKANGTEMIGERNGRTRLTVEQVREARRRWAVGDEALALAREFGVGQTTMEHVLTRRNWAWLD